MKSLIDREMEKLKENFENRYGAEWNKWNSRRIDEMTIRLKDMIMKEINDELWTFLYCKEHKIKLESMASGAFGERRACIKKTEGKQDYVHYAETQAESSFEKWKEQENTDDKRIRLLKSLVGEEKK